MLTPSAVIVAALSVAFTAAAVAPAACVRPSRAGFQVQGQVKICPGRYIIPDRAERGVIIAASSNTQIDLTASRCRAVTPHRRNSSASASRARA
jgi:hypothetical protein